MYFANIQYKWHKIGNTFALEQDNKKCSFKKIIINQHLLR